MQNNFCMKITPLKILETIMHRPISIKDISLSFSNKNCFEHFSFTIYPGSRIAIIGRNGSGKSSLLNILRGSLAPSSGEVTIPNDISIGYVEQTICDIDDLSGGQRFNKRLSEALAEFPNLLLLDEPTNHLDHDNRIKLMQMLKRYQGTLIVVSHDTELLRNCIDTLWHIDNNKVDKSSGSYDDYIRETYQKRIIVEKKLDLLKREKKNMHNALMKQQDRAKKRRAYGKKKHSHDKLAFRGKQSQGETTANKNSKLINFKKNNLIEQLSKLHLTEIIIPNFSFPIKGLYGKQILSINDASIGYESDKIILNNINLSLGGKERIAICGKNGSGKSSLVKAILGENEIFTTGNWHLPRNEYIGYLDQHYSNLQDDLSVIDHIKVLRPDWTEIEVRRHLNDFLFRKNEQVTQIATTLSGGEKARLSLSMIAAKTPRLLILDEITNNLDLETKEHIIQVLNQYPGAMIIISHEKDFLSKINITHEYNISIMRLN